MFQLFKKRDFGENISDTIAFFKTYGKHYFKNYFTINGIFLLILVVLLYFISKVYMEFIFSAMNTQSIGQANYLGKYFSDNMAAFIGTMVVFMLISIFLSIINVAYPVIYLKFLEETGGNDFTTKDIINALKNKMGRLIVFFLGMLFVITPLMIIIFTLNILLCFILIGIPLLFITMPAFLSWLALSFHEYIIKEVGFFEALRNGFDLLKQKFWPTIGTTLSAIILIQMVQGFITMIPYFIGLALVFTSAQSVENGYSPDEAFSGIAILFCIIMVLSVLMGYIFNNFIFINQGMIYYGLREENEETTSKNQIDLIGTDSE